MGTHSTGNRNRNGKQWKLYQKNRLVAFERDNYTCSRCHKSEMEVYKLYRIGLSAHHINFRRNDHRVSNLRTLCSACHQYLHQLHRYKPSTKQFMFNIRVGIRPEQQLSLDLFSPEV